MANVEDLNKFEEILNHLKKQHKEQQEQREKFYHDMINEQRKHSSRRLIGWVTLIVSIGALIVATHAAIITYNQGIIMEKEFAIESIPPQIASFIAADVTLQNDTYDKRPLDELVSISTASTHFLKIRIESIEFANQYGPAGKFTTPPKITVSPIEKFVGNGVTNLEFNVPFELTLNVNQLEPYPPDTTWAGLPIITKLTLIDLQNKTAPEQSFTAFSYLGISGQYLPKIETVGDNPQVNESVKVKIMHQ